MKKVILITCLMFVLATTTTVFAHDYDRDDAGHPLQLISYIIRPIGIGLEYGVFRPIHWIVSRPDYDIIFGHEPHEGDQFFVWE